MGKTAGEAVITYTLTEGKAQEFNQKINSVMGLLDILKAMDKDPENDELDRKSITDVSGMALTMLLDAMLLLKGMEA